MRVIIDLETFQSLVNENEILKAFIAKTNQQSDFEEYANELYLDHILKRERK